MRVRRKLLFIAVGCLAALILLGCVFSPYMAAYRVNRNLDIAGVRLLMTPGQVEDIMGKGAPIGGFGAEFYEYGNFAITVAYPWDGMLEGKSGWIEISAPEYSIYGVKPGDSVDKVKSILERYGFTQDQTDTNFFKRGSAWIYVFESSVRISIEDWTIRGRVY